MIVERNSARCAICGDVVESKHRYDFVTCSCGNLSVDGGHDYPRRVTKYPESYDEMSIIVPDEDDDMIQY